VQNRRLDGEVDAGQCGTWAGTETASLNLETLFKPTYPSRRT
jgi:hypothetical protein